MSQFLIYESRLRKFVGTICGRSDASKSWLEALPKRTPQQWTKDVSALTLPEAKSILAGSEAPQDEDFETLPKIGVVWECQPGVYHGIIFTPHDKSDVHAYTGSATSPGLGLTGRVDQHLDPKFRARNTKRSPSLHYNIVDAPGKNRYGEYRQLCRTEFASGQPEDVLYVRETLIFAEQLYMSWLQTHSRATMKKEPWLAELSPWSANASPRNGLNGRLPIQEGISNPSKYALPVTTEDKNAVSCARQRLVKSKHTVEYWEARSVRDLRYDNEVREPLKKMRMQGASPEDIAAFQADHRRKMAAERKQDPTFVNGVGYVYETATPRSEEERLSDLSGGNVRKRRALGEISGNAAPVKKAKVEDSSEVAAPEFETEVEEVFSDPFAPPRYEFSVESYYPNALRYLQNHVRTAGERLGNTDFVARRGTGTWPGVGSE